MNLWKNLDKITTQLQKSPTKVLMLDFDGTLTPIVKSPEQAKLPLKTRDLLQKLIAKPDVYLAIISGRKLSDIKEKISLPNIIYGGNHDLEGEFFGKKFIHPDAKKIQLLLRRIYKILDNIAQTFKGVLIEDKKIALGFHYRMADRKHIKQIKILLQNQLKDFWDHKLISIIESKKEIDILPKTEWNKGDFAKLIIDTIYSKTKLHPVAVVIGDDTTDESAFGDLKDDITVVVGEKPLSKAKYYLKNQGEVFKFLKLLYTEEPQKGYFKKIKQIKNLVNKKDFENKDFLYFWNGLIRDSSGRWLNYYQEGIKYFKYGKQIKPDTNDNLQLTFIHASIKHEDAFLTGLYNQSFKNFKQWLIKLHRIQSYFGTAGQILSKRRISEGEHTQVVVGSIPVLANKYNDPYTNKGVHIVYLPGIDTKGCPKDEWKNGQVFHFYPDPKFHNQYLQAMKKKLVQFISRTDKKADRKIIKIIANYYQYGINMHMFENVNQSLFGNQANAMLKLLGLKPIEHGIMDFAAIRLQYKNFEKYFLNEVERLNYSL